MLFKKDGVLLVLIVLVGLVGFWMGQESAKGSASPVISFKEADLPSLNTAYVGESIEKTGEERKESSIVVASVNGSKYHKLTCPGAKQIKESNKLFFKSSREAEAAGYTPAANCEF